MSRDLGVSEIERERSDSMTTREFVLIGPNPDLEVRLVVNLAP